MAATDSPPIYNDVNKEAIRLFYGFKDVNKALKYFNASNNTGLDSTNIENGIIKKEVVDDIITVALWHRTLDPPYFGNTLIEKTIDKVKKVFNPLFGEEMSKHVKYDPPLKFLQGTSVGSNIPIVKQYTHLLLNDDFIVMIRKNIKPISDNKKSAYNYLKENTEIMGIKISFGSVTVGEIITNFKNLVIKLLYGSATINGVTFNINEIFNLVHSWNKDKLIKEGISPQDAEIKSKQIADKMKKEFKSRINDELLEVTNTIVLLITDLINEKHSNEEIKNYFKYIIVRENDTFKENLSLMVSDTIKYLFEENGIKVARPNLNNEHQRNIINNVIKKKSELSSAVYDLWKKNMDIRDENDKVISWEDYKDDNNDKLRLNILNMNMNIDGSINKKSQLQIPLLNGKTNAFEMTSCAKQMELQEQGLFAYFLTGENKTETVVVKHWNVPTTAGRNILRILYNTVYRHSEFNFDHVTAKGLFASEEERAKFMKHLCFNYEQSLQHLSVYNPRNEALRELDALVKRTPKERDDINRVSRIPGITKASLDVFEVLYDFTTNSTYAYKGDGKLYKRDADGNFTIDISPGTAEGIKETAKACEVSGVKSDCNLYLSDCLLNGDVDGIEKCSGMMVQMSDSELDKFIKDEIDNIYPPLALRVLQLLGIRKKKLYSEEARKPIYVVESVAHWLHDFVGKKFDGTFQNKVAKNSKLLKYLNAMVQFVNNHPGLLNNDYTGKPPIKRSVDSGFPNLPRSGNLPPRDSMGLKLDRLENHLRREADIIQNKPTVDKMLEILGKHKDYLVPNFIYDTLGGLIRIRDPTIMESSRSMISNLVGGQYGGTILAENLGRDLIEGKSFGSADSMKELYYHILKLLKQENKHLDSTTSDNFNKMLKELREAEDTVINELNIIKDFIEIYRRHSPSNDGKDVLSKKDIEQYAKEVAAHERRFKKGEIAFITNLKKLAKHLGVKIETGDITITKHDNLNLE